MLETYQLHNILRAVDTHTLAVGTDTIPQGGPNFWDFQLKSKEGGWPSMSAPRTICWSPNGKKIHLAGGDGVAEVIDVETKTLETGWPGLPQSWSDCRGSAWSPDGARIARNTSEGHQIIDVATKSLETGWDYGVAGQPNMWDSAWSPDGQYLAVTVGGTVSILDTATKEFHDGAGSIMSEVRGVTWSPDSTRIAAFGLGADYFVVYNVDTQTEESGWPTYSANVVAVVWSPFGDRLFVGDGTNYDIIDVATKTIESGWPSIPNHGISRAAWSENGKHIAFYTQGANNDLYIADVTTKTLVGGWPSFNNGFQSSRGLAFNNNSGNVTNAGWL